VWFWLLLGVAVGAGLTMLMAHWHQRRTRRRAVALEARARQSERLAFAGALASGLAHELKNPLSTLRLNLQLLAEDLTRADGAPPSRMQGRVEVLSREIERLNDVLNDYLRFARQRRLDRAPADLNNVLDELLEFIRPEAVRRNVEVRHQFAADLPLTLLDVNLLKQALLNLIVNAFEAMPDGGELIVQTETDGSTITARFTDTGCGVPADEVDNIFRVYYSTKQTGTGLGLPTARRIVQEHGGSLHLSSEPGRGTQVTIELPVEAVADGDREPLDRSAHNPLRVSEGRR